MASSTFVPVAVALAGAALIAAFSIWRASSGHVVPAALSAGATALVIAMATLLRLLMARRRS